MFTNLILDFLCHTRFNYLFLLYFYLPKNCTNFTISALEVSSLFLSSSFFCFMPYCCCTSNLNIYLFILFSSLRHCFFFLFPLFLLSLYIHFHLSIKILVGKIYYFIVLLLHEGSILNPFLLSPLVINFFKLFVFNKEMFCFFFNIFVSDQFFIQMQ